MTEREHYLLKVEGQKNTVMNCESDIEKFVHALAESDHSVPAAGKAFGLISDGYHIGKVFMKFVAPSTPYTESGDKRDFILFDADIQSEEEIGYERKFRTGEGGSVEYALYRTKGAGAFSEEEKRNLDVIMEILFFHCGRWRLINQVKKLAHTDSLTGFPNSGGFLTYVDELLDRQQLTEYNAFYFNLTRFSLVNRQFGTRETDTIVARYSEELAKFLEEGECIGRLGGDNFVALIRKGRTNAFLELISGVETYGMLGDRKIPVKISAVAGALEIDEKITNCGMASDLHMGVVAEGVENWQQVDYLRRISCKVVQGFLFDKPLPKAVFEEKLRTGRYEIDSDKNI